MKRRNSMQYHAFSSHFPDSEPTEAEKSVTEDEDDSTDLQVKIEDELPESSKSL